MKESSEEISTGERPIWTPPQRPEWVSRINAEGDCMDICGVVPLAEESLLNAARARTGLSDFGEDGWREPFRIFIKSLEEEANLNLLGRIRSRSEILQLLTARLQIEDTYKRHPEINGEEIVEPSIVVGQGRSGTSFLINLLAAHPDNGALQHWEAMFPCPPPEKATYATDPRIEECQELITQWYRVTPSLAAMHEFGGSIPVESVLLMSLNFTGPSWLDALGQVPSYDAYMAKADIRLALRYQKRVLKLLQWKNPRKRWVLKDVSTLDYLEPLLQLHPDALLVWPHRDPVRALASMVNTIGTVQWGRTDHPLQGGSYDYLTDLRYAARRLEAVVDQLEAGIVPPEQICHIQYRDLVTNSMATVEKIYCELNVPLTAEAKQAMARYLAENARDSRSAHRFSLGSDEDIADARAAFRRYQRYFNIPDE